MTRTLPFVAACLCAGTAFGQSVLVNTRLQPAETLAANDVLQLDLKDFFKRYPEPGPVATFTIFMPEPDGMRTYQVGDQTIETMGYKLASGESYDDPYAVAASDFAWTEHAVEFQLLPAEAPVTVANFMSYAADGAYTDTIVHRNESTGRAFRPGGEAFFQPLPIIQAGGLRLYPTDDYLLEWIPNRAPIPLEQSRVNNKGTLAMARGSLPDTATSQFFINLGDNERNFGNLYAVFGELLDPEGDQPVLDQFAAAPIYDLSSPYPSGNPNRFPNLPFGSLPMYTPWWDDKASYARFSSIEVSAGDPDGISYSWAWREVEGEGEAEADPGYNPSAFQVSIDGSVLSIGRTDTGYAILDVSGSTGSDDAVSFAINLLAFRPEALDKFPDSAINPGGWLESAWYGWVFSEAWPLVFHANHGRQWILPDGDSTTLYAHDELLDSLIYTTTRAYPHIYVYRLGKWVYFAEGSGNGVLPSRWFYTFEADNPRWVYEEDL
jgi:cyclophilin family peptidyl-prolyl cis-trans isomerase